MMLYRWVAPNDVEEDEVFRLKLTTDVPPTTHFSGKLTFSHSDAASSSVLVMEDVDVSGLPTDRVAKVVLVGIISMILIWWVVARLRRRSQRIVLS